MKTRIKSFNQFVEPIHEADGFGTSPYLLIKVEGIYHYFFNLDREDEGQNGYHFIVGKYSDKEIIEGAKNSYCVLGLNQIAPELIEDIALDDTNIPAKDDEKFKMGSSMLSRLMKYVYLCVSNYLEANPKVARIYDEIQDNLQFVGEGSYLEYMKSICIAELGSGWSVQEGSSPKTILISR